MNKKLWNRTLSCGHSRETTINYLMKIYTKPKVGNECFCRECWKGVKIVKVEEVKK